MNTKNIWTRVQYWCGWLALLLLAVSIISGYGWDIRTSDLIYRATGGLLNRKLSADLHTTIMVPMVFVLFCHIVLSLRRFWQRRK